MPFVAGGTPSSGGGVPSPTGDDCSLAECSQLAFYNVMIEAVQLMDLDPQIIRGCRTIKRETTDAFLTRAWFTLVARDPIENMRRRTSP